jgi:hypothetical protein
METDLKFNTVRKSDLYWEISWCCRGVVESYPYALDRSLRLQELEASSISWHSTHKNGKTVSSTYRPPFFPFPHFCGQKDSENKKKSLTPFGYRNSDFQGCHALPQPNVPPRTPAYVLYHNIPVSFATSDPCNCECLLLVFIVSLIMDIYVSRNI